MNTKRSISLAVALLVLTSMGILTANMIVILKRNESRGHLHSAQPNTETSMRRSMSTTVECIGPEYNQSCLYKNLYYVNGGFWALSLKEANLSLPGVRLDALATSDYRPKHREFNTSEELDRFVRFDIDPRLLSGLTIHFNPHWLRNIGHALFDGLYPAYVALIRFSPRHLQPFRILVGVADANCDDCFSEDVFSRFAGLGLIKSNTMDGFKKETWFVFEEFIMGSGMMCQRCIQSNYQLAGGVELDGSRLFRDRMYKQHGVLLPTSRHSHSAQERDPGKPLNVYVIDNKRFTEDERREIKLASAEINNYTDRHIHKSMAELKKLPWPLMRVVYLSYRNVTANKENSLNVTQTRVDARSPTYELNDNDFTAQLRVLRDMDIHITGPGTGQMYQTFLSDGSININLGGLNPYQKETTPIAYPSFLEQYVTAGTPYIKGLYYPINKRRDGIKRVEVVKLIRQAGRMIMKGFPLPVNPTQNLAPDGQVFVEQCKNDEHFCSLVTLRKPGYFWCNNMWTEDLVHERRQWAVGGFPIGGANVSCAFNRTLLRSLRQTYGIEYRYGVE